MKDYNKKVSVSFIILNYRCCKFAKECVDSILHHVDNVDYEILVVDNGSGSDEQFELEKLFENTPVELIRNKWNAGFGLGNMMGANFASGKFLCFLNPDTYIDEDCVTPLCQFLDEHNEVGCVSPRQMRAYANDIQNVKGHDCNGIISMLKIPGSFMMFKAETFWKIGGFDTNIFLYCEEEDVGRRLNKIGKHCAINTYYHYYHHVGVTTKRDRKSSKETEKEYFRSKLYVYRKHHNVFLSVVNHLKWIVKVAATPRRWYCLSVVLSSESMSRSMRHQV